ncbi:MAG: transporter substrate-binding domain-containing protein [Lachnospiraceae bacterium]|nr:transporter substrate-binding domain-containing protein [Lachnospiraceae bacterium]
MKKFLSVCAAGLTAIALSASFVPAEADQVATIQAAGKVVMSTNAEFEPFEYKDSNDIVGIDPEIAAKIAEKLGVELEITDIAFDSLIPSMNKGKADFIAAGMTATEERSKNVDFSVPYFNASQSIIVLADSEIKSRTDLNDKTVGVQQGTTGDIYCTDEDGTSDIKVKDVKRYSKGMDAVSDLIAGRVDAVVIDDFPASKLVEKNPEKLVKLDEAMTEEEYAIAMPKGSNLKEVVDQVITELQESGELDAIVSKYIEVEGVESEAEASK